MLARLAHLVRSGPNLPFAARLRKVRSGPFTTEMGKGNGPISALCTFRREGREAALRCALLRGPLWSWPVMDLTAGNCP